MSVRPPLYTFSHSSLIFPHTGSFSPSTRLGITHEIKEMADYVRAEVSEDNEQLKTMEHSPYDPNLVCPMCKKSHRVGEIQKYRKHVDTCDGGIDADEHMYR